MTEPVKRYRLALAERNEFSRDGMKRDKDGPYVLHSDYARLEQEREQLDRIIAVDAAREKNLRGKTAWHPLVFPDRPDFLAWREAEDGRIELLTYNNGLCDPISIEVTTRSYLDAALAPAQEPE